MLDLVLIRHGQSTWNAENLFTGWVDVDLTPAGEAEARAGGELLAEAEDLDLRLLHTSVLTRAIRTAEIALAAAGRSWLPVRRDWRLNERHYGDLQGKNKAAIKQEFGAEQLQLWRRSYDIAPPALALDDPRHPRYDPRYHDVDPALLPATESLKDTLARVLPFWKQRIAPELLTGRNVLVTAHGNSLRAMVKMLDNRSESDIVELNIPTGVPLLYELDAKLAPISSRYLGDPAAIAAAAEAVRRQTEKR